MVNEDYTTERNPTNAPQPEAATQPPAEQIRYPSGLVLPSAQGTQTQPRREALKRGTGKDLALALVLLGFCFLLWDSLFWAEGLGLGEALGLFALMPAALIYLRDRPGRMTGYGLLLTALSLLGAASLALSGDMSLKVLTMMTLSPLFLIVLLERLGLRTGTGLLARLRDLFTLWFARSFGRIHVGAWTLTHVGEKDSARSKRTRAILIGLACAVPALLILIPLLVSSDAAFAGLVGKLDWDSVGKALFALVPGSFAALVLFSLLLTAAPSKEPARNVKRRGLEPAAVIAFLAAVSAAYVLYLVSQFAYFTDAFRGLLPKDFTVAEYARRGFFEMCAIVAINLLLIVLSVGLCRKSEGKLPGAVKGLALFLCLFSLVLVATALSKMVLYMRSFGLTRLRVLTSAFMIFLAVVVVAEALRLFVKKVPAAQLAVTLGAAILIALSLLNVDGLVARYNVEAWRSGRLDSLDMKTICELGDGAVPTLAELAGEKDETISAAAAEELDDRLVRFGFAEWKWDEEKRTSVAVLKDEPNSLDLRSWNLVSARAYEALKEVIRNK